MFVLPGRFKMLVAIIPSIPKLERGHRSIKGGKACPQGCRKEEDHRLGLKDRVEAAERFLPDTPDMR